VTAFTVELAPAARRQLRKLDRPVRERLYRRMRRLETDPRPKTAVQLQGASETFFRVREGDWRIIYTIEDDRLIVLVVRIAHRSIAYRHAP
jgi:mRNA interferase RelE/StbE